MTIINELKDIQLIISQSNVKTEINLKVIDRLNYLDP